MIINTDLLISLSLIFVSGLLSFSLAKGKARLYLVNDEPLRSMPIYHGLYVSLWTILPSLFLLISLLIFKSNILNFLVTPYLSESIISLGLDEIIYVKSFLINNISNLTSLVESEFLSKDMAYSLNEKYYLGRLIIFSSLISLSLIFSLITYRNLSIRFDARRKVEAIFKFIFINR